MTEKTQRLNVTIDWTSELHVFANGTDWIIGETVESAVAGYCEEIGEKPVDYPRGPRDFELVDDNKEITAHDDDGTKTTKTARQWIEHNISVSRDPLWFSRLVCSTEY